VLSYGSPFPLDLSPSPPQMQVPVVVQDTAVELLSLDPVQRAAVHCRCSKDLEAVLVKGGNASGTRRVNLTLTVSRPDLGYPNYTAWSAQLAPGSNGSLVTLLQADGTVSDGVPIELSPVSLGETATGRRYRATVAVNVTAGSTAGECSHISVGVRATVLASTAASQTVWGWVPIGMPCAAAGPPAVGLLPDWTLPMVLGEERSVAFTGCDYEGLVRRVSLPHRLSLHCPRLSLPTLPHGAALAPVAAGSLFASLQPWHPVAAGALQQAVCADILFPTLLLIRRRRCSTPSPRPARRFPTQGPSPQP